MAWRGGVTSLSTRSNKKTLSERGGVKFCKNCDGREVDMKKIPKYKKWEKVNITTKMGKKVGGCDGKKSKMCLLSQYCHTTVTPCKYWYYYIFSLL